MTLPRPDLASLARTASFRSAALAVSAACAAGGALGCGSTHAGYLDVGSGDDGGTDLDLTGADASGLGPLDAHIDQNGIAVTFVTLTCNEGCADVEAVATGGTPPYSFTWDDGSKSAARHVCPASSTSYHVTVTDTGTSGELAHAAQTVQVPLDARVVACPDGGLASDAGLGACDSVSSLSPAGTNPFGPWSLGWSSTLGSAFTLQTEFLMSPTTNGLTFTGLDVWTSGVEGIEINPSACFNPSSSPDDIATMGEAGAPWVIGPRQLFLHPGPASQYSIARYTVSSAGVYAVSVTFEGIAQPPSLTTTDVHVQHDGADAAGGAGFINVSGGGNTFTFSARITAAGGDTFDFAVGDGGNTYLSDSTAVTASVCKATGGDGG